MMTHCDLEQNPLLILGDGRVGSHFKAYLTQRSLPWIGWTRKEGISSLQSKSELSSMIFMAVSDPAIPELCAHLPANKLKIHFSGRLNLPEVLALHPLMNFGSETLSKDFYDQIPLVMDQALMALPWIQELPNPKATLPPEKRALYHGLCHLAGSFPKLIWEEISEVFESELKLPRKFLEPILTEVLHQVTEDRTDLSSGPFGRKDLKAIDFHRQELEKFPRLLATYNHFYDSFNQRTAK